MQQNVNQYERYASALVGGWLAMKGIGRGTFPGLAIAALGYMLVQRGVTGHCSLYDQMGVNTNESGGMGLGQQQGQQGRQQEQAQPAMAR